MDKKLKYIDINIPAYAEIITSKRSFTKQDIKDFVDSFKQSNLIRFTDLERYFNNKSMVDLQETTAEFIPNHKVKAASARYITNMATSYFMGISPTWKTEDEALDEIINAITTSNVDGNYRYKIAKDCSVYGVGYGILWRDEEAHYRYSALNPKETFIVRDATIEKRPILAIRVVTINKDVEMIEVYDNDYKWSYTSENGNLTETIDSAGNAVLESHNMNQLPIIEYKNNLDRTSDFEFVLNEIEAYNVSISTTANDISAFADAYLVLTGYNDTTKADWEAITEERVLPLDPEGKAEFITKATNDTMQVNYRAQLLNDIHKYSQVPNLSDETFAGNLSGVAIRFKLIGLDALAGEKEQMMRESMRLELEAIANHITQRGLLSDTEIKLNSDDYVTVTFHRNLPQNEVEMAQMLNSLQTLLSDETLIAQVPFVDDVNAEIERKRNELEEESVPTTLFTQAGEKDVEETEE